MNLINQLNHSISVAQGCQLAQFQGREGGLNEYEYSVLRWFQEPDTGFWHRKRMNFISNFRKVEYLGELCWLGEVLQALETGKGVD